MHPAETSPLDAALDDLAALSPTNTGGIPCAIARIMQALPPETAKRIRHLIDETQVQSTLIAEALDAAGYSVSYQSVQRHRRRITKPGSGCRCAR